MTYKKLVVFGAGKIGRSFIGQVFSRSGFEVVFIDIDRQLIDRLNEKKQYRVVIKSEQGDEVLLIKNVRGVHFDEIEKVTDELANATIAAVSVGQNGLYAALPLIAKGLTSRFQKHGEWPLDIIIAENMRHADRFIAENLVQMMPEDYPIKKLLGLVETSIGKMVPIMSAKDLEDDPLQIFAEPYNTLIVAKAGFKNPVPDIKYLAPKENIKAWVDRKLFIHNLGHATAAYLGFQKDPEWTYVYQALEDREVYEATRRSMMESANILLELYPKEFTLQQLEDHIDDLLSRFRNKALGDTLFRVGSDLFRKLSPDDRMAAPIHAAIRLKKPYGAILEALVAGIYFRAKDENGRHLPSDEKFFAEASKGVPHVLKTICRLDLQAREH